ncbi:hypothetical protein ACQ9A1_08800, partial [Escherichia coli]
LPSETMIWQPEFTDKTLSRKPGAVHSVTQYSKDIAWKAQQRLCSRYRSLTAKGKKSQVAITAVARELTGFMWDIALAAQSSFSQQKQN